MKVFMIAFALLLAIPILAAGAAANVLSVDSNDQGVFIADGDLATRVLSHPRISLTPSAIRDVESGVVDPRVLSVLLILAERHDPGRVGPFRSGHSYFVKGTTRVSNHVSGRAVDISIVDGKPVSASNNAAFDAVNVVLSLQAPLRPDEIGSPWRIDAKGSFTNGGHRDHIHIGWSSANPRRISSDEGSP